MADSNLRAEMARAAVLTKIFYVTILSAVLFGNVTGMLERPDFSALVAGHTLLAAILIATVTELAGVVVLNHAAKRRRIGEQATFALVLSAGFAAGAALFNLANHSSPFWGRAFAAGSVGGYLIFVMVTEAERRDWLRGQGKLRDTDHKYSQLQWLSHPMQTTLARRIGRRSPELTSDETLDAARTALDTQRRDKAFARYLPHELRKVMDPRMADMAVHVLDFDQLASESRAKAALRTDAITERMVSWMTPDAIALGAVGQTPVSSHRTAPKPRGQHHRVLDVDPDPPTDGGQPHVLPAGVTELRPRRALTAAPHKPTPEQLADTLGHHFPDEPVGRPSALPLLREAHGGVSTTRAATAVAIHNERIRQQAQEHRTRAQ